MFPHMYDENVQNQCTIINHTSSFFKMMFSLTLAYLSHLTAKIILKKIKPLNKVHYVLRNPHISQGGAAHLWARRWGWGGSSVFGVESMRRSAHGCSRCLLPSLADLRPVGCTRMVEGEHELQQAVRSPLHSGETHTLVEHAHTHNTSTQM